MPKIYIDRLIVIREMLNSPQQETVQEAYDLLFELWTECFEDTEFVNDLRKFIVGKYPNMAQEFTDRLNKSPRTEEKKAELLKTIVLLYPSIIVPREIYTRDDAEKSASRAAPKIFISYSHKDESFKNDLMIMLAGLQRRGVIDVWQDRRIEAGENWFNAIQKAMQECKMAALFVSPDFIASRFIQEEELTHLFQRRIVEGLRVVPIIIRSCLWQSEPILKDLQALPIDGKPVISFSKENGDRDQVWMEIGKAIENIAMSL